ncbi:MAG: hypothetical protein OXR73_04425 [Myxococcales bacterium]|nr:hypothetical protein [Myxococcales bacterium]
MVSSRSQRPLAPNWEALLWGLGYLGLRGAFLATHDGSYIDEYLHVFAGQALLDHGALPSFYVHEVYDRGWIISGLTGTALGALGRAMWAAKLVPMALGFLSLTCLWSLSQSLWPAAANARRALYIVFLLNPWTLFNHYYLRMYALYEFALLCNLFVLLRLTASCLAQHRSWRNALPWVLALAIGNAGLWLSTRDAGAAPVILAALLGLAYLWVAVVGHPESARAQNKRAVIARSLGLLGAAMLALLVPEVRKGVSFWLTGALRFTSSTEHKYAQLFFHNLLPWTALVAVGAIGSWRADRSPLGLPPLVQHGRRLISLVCGGLLLAHLASSPDLQITRGILYLMPGFFLLGILGAHMLWTILNARLAPPLRGRPLTRASAAVVALLLLVILHAYPSEFWTRPGLPSEISYIDYARAYASVRTECQGMRIIDASPSPHIGLFYGVKPHLAIAKLDHSRQDLMVHRIAGRLQTVFGGIPVARELRFEPRARRDNRPAQAVARGGDCLMVRRPSAGRLLSKPFRRALRKGRPLAEFHNVTLYRFASGVLRVQ